MLRKYIKYSIFILILLFSLSVFAADPVLITITKDGWQKVATNVTAGQIHIKNNVPNAYWQTYRDTGGGAPTSRDEGVRMPFGKSFDISAAAGIDVYIYCTGSDGRIRLDL